MFADSDSSSDTPIGDHDERKTTTVVKKNKNRKMTRGK